MNLVLASGVSAATERFFMIWVVLGVVGSLILQPFARRIGGNQANDGGPGGSEKSIVGVTWFLAAIATGIYMAHDAVATVAVG